MADSQTPRRLAAVLSADVQGYSRLMGRDEEGTLRALTESRAAIAEQVRQHRGRVVNTTGDAVLVEFGSVVDAVQCAVGIQRTLAERNAPLPPEQRMLFRIGINLGDVLVQADDIFGDGVNIAARMEALAEGGGICLSGSAYDQVESKLDLVVAYLGEQQVKNIAKPVRAYRVAPDGSVAQPAATPRSAAPEARTHQEASAHVTAPRPSLAILPFANTSGDSAEDFVGDGITEDLITDLSRISRLSVVPRNLAFAYKGRAVNSQQVGKELAARYVLEGSVRKSGERVRLNVQLIDTQSGHTLYAERFDRALKDLFEMQDEITRAIADELEIQLLDGEQARDWQDPTLNPKAVHLMRQGRRWVTSTFSATGWLQARRLFEQAAQLDPKFARAHIAVAIATAGAMANGADPDLPGWLEAIRTGGERAMAVDPTFPLAHSAVAWLHIFRGEAREALARAEQGAALGSDHADAVGYLGWILLLVGYPEKALAAFRRAQILTPTLAIYYRVQVGMAHLVLARHAEAVAALTPIVREVPDSLYARAGITAAYAALGQASEAEREAKEMLRLLNGVPFKRLAPTVLPFTDPAPRERIVALLASAGVE